MNKIIPKESFSGILFQKLSNIPLNKRSGLRKALFFSTGWSARSPPYNNIFRHISVYAYI